MNRIGMKSKVNSEGVLILSVPVGLEEADKEVQVTVGPVRPQEADDARGMAGLGGLDGRHLARRLRATAPRGVRAAGAAVMTYLLDSNTCIGWLRQSQPKLVARIKREDPKDIVICSVVVGELIYGAERAAPAHQANNRMRVEQLRQQFVSLPFEDVAAEHYGKVRAHLAVLGTPIGPNDLMIAAIASASSR